uniref:Minor tail protein n=1 Tax=Streptomyces sp. NBC_00049 TaxID=2903617 RepID=A0AAU2JVI3_9ACTN
MNVRSAWLPVTGQTRSDTRIASLGALTPTSPVATRSGILPGSPDGKWRISGFTVMGTTAMGATVYPGRAVIQGTDAQGAYPVALTQTLGLTFADGHAQYPRIDLIVLRVRDDEYDATGRTDAAVEIITGVPAATPVAPATPALSLALYTVAVPAGTSAGNGGINWTNALVGQRTTTVGLGGILPVTSDTAIGAYPGQYRDIDGGLQRWDGTAWMPYPPKPAWQNWTPVWTTYTGNGTPSFGNAEIVARWVQQGPTVHMNFAFTFGTTTNFGAGATSADNWRFTLPVKAASAIKCVGFADLMMGTRERAVARIRCTSTSFFELEIASGMPSGDSVVIAGITDAVSPWTWAAGHTIHGSATYEAAAQ